ncbi:TreB [Staphylococcus phage Stau2]|uniref:TreB n=2 Tax=Silviavirus TaxID=1857889 RepID=A0A0U1ZUG4_9CAUD|nr:hypothetical protein F422_gp042 [Staphylococcus phage SA11]YP_009275882.1 TreB [Staphylococcus phage Stau2]ARQ95761.1 hypothetical protein qdsa001_3 [Staphylococcus phage qdsa001]UVD42386.1 membrane protein [Staphylococcus phage vB_SauM-V1SA19]WAW11859.1 hypothetical protein [Staphylococcus phage StAP1]WAW12074.1 hypothetical protein [Staphylococcus phage SAP6]WBF47847.1 hypothetical protein SSP49_22 [Staphylococcus phage SSP49]WJZ48700.1 membrane protein [Staphylococcus phage SAC]BEU752
MIGLTMLLTIVAVMVLFMYTFILVEMVQSIKYDRFDKWTNIVSFTVMTVVLVSSILALFGI